MDEKEVFAEVERRRNRARSLGLVDLVFRLYFDGIKHYAAWSTSIPDAVHPDFRSATPIPKRAVDKAHVEGVQIRIGGSEFVFLFDSHTTIMPDGESCEFGTLSLAVDGESVFAIECVGDYDDVVGIKWVPHVVAGFIEGPWIQPLADASKKIVDWKDTYNQESAARRNREKAEELKKKFGL